MWASVIPIYKGESSGRPTSPLIKSNVVQLVVSIRIAYFELSYASQRKLCQGRLHICENFVFSVVTACKDLGIVRTVDNRYYSDQVDKIVQKARRLVGTSMGATRLYFLVCIL